MPRAALCRRTAGARRPSCSPVTTVSGYPRAASSIAAAFPAPDVDRAEDGAIPCGQCPIQRFHPQELELHPLAGARLEPVEEGARVVLERALDQRVELGARAGALEALSHRQVRAERRPPPGCEARVQTGTGAGQGIASPERKPAREPMDGCEAQSGEH